MMLEGDTTLKPNYPLSLHFFCTPKICNKICVAFIYLEGAKDQMRQSYMEVEILFYLPCRSW